MRKLNLSLASVNYDRFRGIEDGRIDIEGIDITFLPLPVEETFYRQLKYREFDVSEMSLSSYVLTLKEEPRPFVALPVFPSRYFRHQTMFVNDHANIHSPEDLRGKRVGVPEFQITAGVWQRGMLQDEFGVRPSEMVFFSGGVESPGRHEKVTTSPAKHISVVPIANNRTLSNMLLQDELDALFTAHVPSIFYSSGGISRLFPDYKNDEQQYFAKTGIFPIMHVIVIKRDLYERHPWVGPSLMKAFEESLSLAQRDLMYRSSLKVMLPWLAHHVEETVFHMGENYWKYGVQANRLVLETFLRYSYEQGLSERLWDPSELFVGNVESSYVI